MVSTIGINSFSILHTHIQRHAECMLHAFEPLLYVLFCFSWPQDSIKFIHSFHALTLISDPAWIILASGQLHKYCVSRSLTTSLLPYSPLSHTPVLLFICFLHIFFFTCFPFSYLGMQNVCVSVCGERWWIIHVVVSWSVRQTVETVNCPSGPFSPTAHCS